jgi:hypothetical protein
LLSKRRHEGYLLIDHSNSPGIPGRTGKLECSVVTCSHCQRGVMLNPDRSRPRAYCPSCDHYICDQCEAIRAQTGCKTFKQIMDEVCERAIKEA